jgi:hypothetical protein
MNDLRFTTGEIGKALREINDILTGKLGASPYLSPMLFVDEDGEASITIYGDRRLDGDYARQSVSADTIEGVLAKAKSAVMAMPDAAALRRAEWEKSFASLIKEGREIGVSEDAVLRVEEAKEAFLRINTEKGEDQ